MRVATAGLTCTHTQRVVSPAAVSHPAVCVLMRSMVLAENRTDTGLQHSFSSCLSA